MLTVCRNSSVVILLRQLWLNHMHFQLNSVGATEQSVRVLVTFSYNHNKTTQLLLWDSNQIERKKKVPPVTPVHSEFIFFKESFVCCGFDCFLFRRSTS